VIICTGTITLDPAKADEAKAVMRKAMEATLTEAGCRSYRFTADLSEPGVFHIAEEWDDAEAVESHAKEPHYLELIQAMGPLGVTGVSIWQHEVSASKQLM
jgi:quinol monooxygenase YgiN